MKFITLSVIIIGIIILFNAGGIETDAGGLVKQFLDGGLVSLKTSEFWSQLTGILAVTGGIALVGFFTSAAPESYIIAGFTSFLAGVLITDMLSIYMKILETGEVWMMWVASSIFIPFAIVFVLSAVSFWRGADG